MWPLWDCEGGDHILCPQLQCHSPDTIFLTLDREQEWSSAQFLLDTEILSGPLSLSPQNPWGRPYLRSQMALSASSRTSKAHKEPSVCRNSGCPLVLVSGPLGWKVPTQTCGLIVRLKFGHVCAPSHAQSLGPESVTLHRSCPQTVLKAASDMVFQFLVFSTSALRWTVWATLSTPPHPFPRHCFPHPHVYLPCPSLPSLPRSP